MRRKEMVQLGLFEGMEMALPSLERYAHQPQTVRLHGKKMGRRKEPSDEVPVVSQFDPLKYVRVREAALLLGVSIYTVRQYIARGVLRRVRLLGRYVLIPLEDILELWQARRQKLKEEYEALMVALFSMDDAERRLQAVRKAFQRAQASAGAAYHTFFQNQVLKPPEVEEGI